MFAVVPALVLLSVVQKSRAYDTTLQAPAYVGKNILTVSPFTFEGTPKTQFHGYPLCKKGKRQTPIAIKDPLTPNPSAKFSLSKEAFHVQRIETLVNAGHYAQIVHDPKAVPKQYASFLGKKYLFSNVHFHTGEDNHEGSDHTLFGKRFPLEVHVVYYQPQFGTLRQALDSGVKDAVLIVATFYEIGKFNPEIEEVVNNLKRIATTNATVTYHPVHVFGTIANFMPDTRSKYYYYYGSLEAPPCQESVVWLVWHQAKQLGEHQMSRFRGVLRQADGELQVKSWRFLQPRNRRKLFVVAPKHGSKHESGTFDMPKLDFDF